MQKIGLYAGSFDPIHLGHMAFAHQSIIDVDLDLLYVIAEKKPWRKSNLTDHKHRQAMVDIAFSEDQKINTKLSGMGQSHDTKTTLSVLNKQHPDSQKYLLMGGDEFLTIDRWQNLDTLISNFSFIVGLRSEDDGEEVIIKKTMLPEINLQMIATDLATVSSSKELRNMANKKSPKIDPKVLKYIQDNNLYAL